MSSETPAQTSVRTGIHTSALVIEDSRSDREPVCPDKGRSVARTLWDGQIELIIADLMFQSEYDLDISGPDLLKISFIQRGWFDLTFDKHFVKSPMDGKCVLLSQPSGMVKRQHNIPGNHHQIITFVLSPLLISELVASSETSQHSLERVLAQVGARDFFFNSYIMTPAMQSCIRSMPSIDLTNSLSEILLESKSLELLYLFLDAVREDTLATEEKGLCARDVSRISSVRELLDTAFAAPPNLDELSRLACMSRSKFAQSFKLSVGETVGEYCHRLRMQKARQLLENERMSVSEIAYIVGYEHQSSFSHAYRMFFGKPPKYDRTIP